MTAILAIERLLGIADEVIFPALAAYVIWLLRGWLSSKWPIPKP